MDSVKVIRPLVLKIKVTESFKQEMLTQLVEARRRVDGELQHLDFQAKRISAELEKKNPAGLPAAREHLEKERKKREDNQKTLREKAAYFEGLAIGAEIVQGTLDSVAEMRPGDDIRDILSMEVLICDNRVVEIRRCRQ